MSESPFPFIQAHVLIVQGLFFSHVLYVLAICMTCTGLTSLSLPCAVSCCPAPGQSVSPCLFLAHFLACLGLSVSLSHLLCPKYTCEALGHLSEQKVEVLTSFHKLHLEVTSPPTIGSKIAPAISAGEGVGSGQPSASLLFTVLFPEARSTSSWGWLS